MGAKAGRVLALAYGMAAYLLFAGVYLYMIAFLADSALVPKAVDDASSGPVWVAVLADASLLGLFAVQHTVMARPWFKRWWTRVIPEVIERSTFVLAADLVVALLIWQWRGWPAEVWSVPAGWARALLWAVNLLGWGIVVFSTFLLGHTELFGVRQVLARLRGRRLPEPRFRQPLLYRLVRHPLMTGFFIAFWATPDMSAGRLLFAIAASGYILVGVRFEEHDLRRQLGAPYERYAAEVPRFVPSVTALAGRRRPPAAVLGDETAR